MHKIREMIAALGFEGVVALMGIASGLAILQGLADDRTEALDALDREIARRDARLVELAKEIGHAINERNAAVPSVAVKVVDIEVVDDADAQGDELVTEPARG